MEGEGRKAREGGREREGKKEGEGGEEGRRWSGEERRIKAKLLTIRC